MTVSRLSPQFHHIHIGQIELAYRTYGKPENPPFLFIHGLSETGTFFWDFLIATLQDHYYCMVPDLPGHGDTPAAIWAYDAASLTTVLTKWLRRIGHYPVHVIGHSLGGIIGIHLAARYPRLVNRLILYDVPISAGLWGNFRKLIELPLTALTPLLPLLLPSAGHIYHLLPRKLILRRLLRRWRVLYDPESPLLPTLLNHGVMHHGVALSYYLRYLLIYDNAARLLPYIASPTLFVMGEYDVLVTQAQAHRWVKKIPMAILRTIPHAGHVSLLDQPEIFGASIHEFLTSPMPQT